MEAINKVLASTSQAFSTAEQKQARDNIGAQASLSYSYSGSAITAIDGSAVGGNGFDGVWHTQAFTGSGTNSSDKLGLNSSLRVSASGDNRTAWYSFSGIEMVNSSGDTSEMTPTGVYMKTDLGGSTAYAWLRNGSLVFETPLPGNDWVSSYFAVGGVRGYGNFGSDNYSNNWISAHWYQNTGDDGDGVWIYRGYHNGSTSLADPSITMYTPGNSATIHLSSISSWNNKMDNVNVGYGLAGDGKSSALSVTGCSGNLIGLHSDYFYELKPYDLTFSSFDKDNSLIEAKTVFNEWGMRLTAATAKHLVTLQDDGFRMGASAQNLTADLNHERLRMTNATGYADLTKSSIDAINAVYNWATSQGMSPI